MLVVLKKKREKKTKIAKETIVLIYLPTLVVKETNKDFKIAKGMFPTHA